MAKNLFENADLMRRFAAIAVKGGSQDEAFTAFLEELGVAGVGASAIEEARAIGSKLFKKETLPRSIKALAGGLEGSQAADEVFGIARAASRDIPDRIIMSEVRRQIVSLRKDNPDLATKLNDKDKQIVRAVRRTGWQANFSPPSGPSARTSDPAMGSPKLLETEAAQLAARPPAAVVAGKVKKRMGGVKKAVIGGAISALLPFGATNPFALAGRGQKAKDAAVQGFHALGATSTASVMSSIVRQQELASRRQIVLQQFEPEIFEKMMTALAINQQPEASLTDSERRIGGKHTEVMPSRKPDEDVKFLMDQMFNEMSGQL
jgi:hypothetical protein